MCFTLLNFASTKLHSLSIQCKVATLLKAAAFLPVFSARCIASTASTAPPQLKHKRLRTRLTLRHSPRRQITHRASHTPNPIASTPAHFAPTSATPHPSHTLSPADRTPSTIPRSCKIYHRKPFLHPFFIKRHHLDPSLIKYQRPYQYPNPLRARAK